MGCYPWLCNSDWIEGCAARHGSRPRWLQRGGREHCIWLADNPDPSQGEQGPAGADGADGEDGLDITWRGNYASGTAYVINDAVFYSGSSYICKLASTGNLPTNTTYWDLMAQQGAAGAGSGT